MHNINLHHEMKPLKIETSSIYCSWQCQGFHRGKSFLSIELNKGFNDKREKICTSSLHTAHVMSSRTVLDDVNIVFKP